VDKVRIGTLGAARITPQALVAPARKLERAEVAAVAARDPARARRFAERHGIPRVHDSYEELVADPELDAVYVPLPNSLHAQWTLAALRAGKHVLCEKPFASNQAQAEQVAAEARSSGLVVMEAFHWRYHPMAERMVELARGGSLGDLQRLSAWVCFPLPFPGNIRYRYELGGGATMDAGCYAIHMCRTLAGAEPKVVSARAKLASPQVDRAMEAELSFPDGARARIACSLFSSRLLKVAAVLEGSAGRLEANNPLRPQIGGRIRLSSSGWVRTERFRAEATYYYQLAAFVAAVAEGRPTLTPPEDSVANMAVIDAVYRAAGLRPRGA